MIYSMKRIAILVFFMVSTTLSFSQTQSEIMERRYNMLVSKVGEAGLGVESVLNTWEKEDSNNLNMLLGKFRYYFNKAQSTQIVAKYEKRYLGLEPVLSLKDSLGRQISYFQEVFYDDELYGQAIKALDKAVSLNPDRLDLRFMKANSLLAYEKGSPDMTLNYLLQLTDEVAARTKDWTFGSEKKDKKFYEDAIQEYCYSLFTIGTSASKDAFMALSVKLNKIFRQAEQSLIVMNAHAINNGEMPVLSSRDNDFFIYGGRKPELNMLYFNPHANIFVGGAMLSARATMTGWDVNFKEINTVPEKTGAELPVSGYDFYVYEGTMPAILPTDGVVMLINMNQEPEGLTAIKGKEVQAPSPDKPFTLSFTEHAHPITQYLNPEKIEVTKYTRMTNWEGFTPLLYCNGEPVLFVKETDGQKIVLMNFSVNYSMISMYVEFPILMYNIIEYFMPATLTDHAFDINETITLNARSDELSIESLDGSYKDKFTEFPQEITLTTPGSYTLSQIPISGNVQIEQFFVKIPSSESNISKTEDELYELIVPKKKAIDDLDLLLYFASALAALIFIERWLQAKDM